MSISNEMITIFDELAKRFGVTIDWTKENVMPYLEDLCNRIIKYETANCIFWLIVCIIGIGLCVSYFVFYIQSFKKAKENHKSNLLVEYYHGDVETSPGGIMLTVFVAGICIAVIIGLFCCVFNLIKINYLPEVFIINFIQGLM